MFFSITVLFLQYADFTESFYEFFPVNQTKNCVLPHSFFGNKVLHTTMFCYMVNRAFSNGSLGPNLMVDHVMIYTKKL